MRRPDRREFYTLEDYQDACEEYNEWIEFKMDEQKYEAKEEDLERRREMREDG